MENSNSRVRSIARRINSGFVWQKIKTFIEIDIFIAVCVCFVCLNLMMAKTPDMGKNVVTLIAGRHISIEGENYFDAVVYLENREEIKYGYSVKEYGDYIFYPVIFLLFYEALSIIGAFSYTANIRRKMKPLNDLAVMAQEISDATVNPEKFNDLEAQISRYNVDGKETYIHTNDEDLHSIEAAINNLIHRMKESQKQQNRFISDASHELRTPIAVIQGYVNMLDRWGKEDESVLDESIEALKNESDHMKELIEQLLFLARGDSGRNTLNIVDADLNQIMHEVFEESMMIDGDHEYKYLQEDDLTPYIVKGDYAMIKQSIRILVQNAAKYSDKGQQIKLAVGKHSDGKMFYMVQDEGVGMLENDVNHIFERFYRSDEARNSSTGGSGLGLSIAKWIVDAHQGSIEVLSRKEFGTRFTVTL